MVVGGNWRWCGRNAGVLPAPASKLAGDPVRCAQNDRGLGRSGFRTLRGDSRKNRQRQRPMRGLFPFDRLRVRMTGVGGGTAWRDAGCILWVKSGSAGSTIDQMEWNAMVVAVLLGSVRSERMGD